MKETEVEFPIRISLENEQKVVFCPVRKKNVLLTPEEWVRQHVLYLLKHQLQINYARIAVERQVVGTTKRFDIVVHDQQTGLPILIVECKRRKEKLSQKTFDQISRYNQQLQVPYLVITNWVEWMAAKVDENGYEFLTGFPAI